MCRSASFLLVLLLAVANASAQTDAPFTNWNSSGRPNASATIHGMVRTSDGHPAAGATVNFMDWSGAPVGATTTDPNGAFRFGPISSGRYDILAESGTQQVRQSISVSMGLNSLMITLPVKQEASHATAPTISVEELKAPEKARKSYKQAAEAYRRGRFEEVEKFLAKALKVYPKYAAAWTLLGLARLTARRFSDAEQPLQTAIENDPKASAPFFALGSLHNMERRFDEAETETEQGLALTPDSSWGYFELCRALLGKKEYEAVLKVVDRSETFLSKEAPVLRVTKAYALVGLKDYSAAQVELERYLRIDPNGPGARDARNLLERIRNLQSAPRQ